MNYNDYCLFIVYKIATGNGEGLRLLTADIDKRFSFQIQQTSQGLLCTSRAGLSRRRIRQLPRGPEHAPRKKKLFMERLF